MPQFALAIWFESVLLLFMTLLLLFVWILTDRSDPSRTMRLSPLLKIPFCCIAYLPHALFGFMFFMMVVWMNVYPDGPPMSEECRLTFGEEIRAAFEPEILIALGIFAVSYVYGLTRASRRPI